MVNENLERMLLSRPMAQAGHWVWRERIWIFQFGLVTATAATSITATTTAATCVIVTTTAYSSAATTATTKVSFTFATIKDRSAVATTKDSSVAAQDNFASQEDIITKEDNFITI
jgi:hypothetical protein